VRSVAPRPPLPPLQPEPKATVRGKSRADNKALANQPRGTTATVRLKGTYTPYDWEDICELGARIYHGTLTLAEIRSAPSGTFKVPYSTMWRWTQKEPPSGMPKWLVEREQRRRTALSKPGGVKGGGSLLAEAEQAVRVQATTLIPPTPPRPLADAPTAEEGDDPSAIEVMCRNCGKSQLLPAADSEGNLWCTCGAALSEPEDSDCDVMPDDV